MAGNNQIQFLRGSRSNSTGKDTISEALKTLSSGQPLYSKDENYLYIGGCEEKMPITIKYNDDWKYDYRLLNDIEADKQYELSYGETFEFYKLGSDGNQTDYIMYSMGDIIQPSFKISKSDYTQGISIPSSKNIAVTSFQRAPVTTNKIKKGDDYVEIDSNGYARVSSAVVANSDVVSASNLISLDKSGKAIIIVSASQTDSSPSFPQIQLATLKEDKITIRDKLSLSQIGIIPSNASVSYLGTDEHPFYEAHIQESYTHIIYGYDKNKQSSLSNRSYIKLYEGTGAPTVTIAGDILPDGGSNYKIGNASNAYKDAYIENVYAKSIISPTITKINERLNELGFKEGTISDFSGSNSSLTKLGNYVIGSMTFAPAKEKIGTIPIGFRPYAKRETKIVVGHYDIIESVNKYHPGTLTFNTDGTIVCSRYEWDSEITTVIFGWDTTSGDYS